MPRNTAQNPLGRLTECPGQTPGAAGRVAASTTKNGHEELAVGGCLRVSHGTLQVPHVGPAPPSPGTGSWRPRQPSSPTAHGVISFPIAAVAGDRKSVV